MEIVRSQNARAIAEFYPHEIFHEALHADTLDHEEVVSEDHY